MITGISGLTLNTQWSPVIGIIAGGDDADIFGGVIIYPRVPSGVYPCVVAALQLRASDRVIEDTFHLRNELGAVTVSRRDHKTLRHYFFTQGITLHEFYSVYNGGSTMKLLIIISFNPG